MQGLPDAAKTVVAESLADTATVAAAKKFTNSVIGEATLYSLGSSLGSFLQGRRLQQVRARCIITPLSSPHQVLVRHATSC